MRLEKVPLDIINRYRLNIDNIIERTQAILKLNLEKNKSKCQNLITKIDALSPLKTLARGYSVVRETDSKDVIKSVKQLEKNQKLDLILQDGTAIVKVE